MSANPGSVIYLASAGDGKVSGTGGGAILHSVSINTEGTSTLGSSTVTIYNGTSTTGTKVATLDCSLDSLSRTLIYDLRMANGVYAVMTGISADVTISVQ